MTVYGGELAYRCHLPFSPSTLLLSRLESLWYAIASEARPYPHTLLEQPGMNKPAVFMNRLFVLVQRAPRSYVYKTRPLFFTEHSLRSCLVAGAEHQTADWSDGRHPIPIKL